MWSEKYDLSDHPNVIDKHVDILFQDFEEILDPPPTPNKNMIKLKHLTPYQVNRYTISVS